MIGVEIIAIGNELLLGKTIDTNSAWLGQQLAAIGLAVRRVTRIADEGPIIRQTLEQALAENQIVLLTGGLGQTKDDITKKVLADFFNTPLVEHAATLQHIEAIYALRGRVVNEVSRQGAFLPAACTVLPNAVGLSPGMQFEAQGGQLVVSLPGVPHEMKYLMETHVFPVLRDQFVTDHVAHRTFCTAGVPESSMAIRLKEFEAQLPEVIQLAYNPSLSQLNLRLTLQCPRSEAQRWQGELERQIASLQTLLVADCFGHEDDTLERVLGRVLGERGLWLATAESCTGGALAARVVSVPGSSAYFRGAVVAYDNAVKLAELGVSPEVLAAEGAVSEAVARAMAEGVRRKLNADIALSTTGVAGPDGGSEAKPVGTVWVGYADAQGSFARKYTFERDRMRNIERTVATALNVARVAVAGSAKTP